MARVVTLLSLVYFGFLSIQPDLRGGEHLPQSITFKGKEVFERLVKKAEEQNWRDLAIGDRTITVAAVLRGTPYKNFTLEIHDHIESPSVNFYGMDCWTLFEISLGFARMLRAAEPPYEPSDLLRMIELERYRGGECDGNYLSRIHYLAEWYYDNEKRGLITNPTKELGGERIYREAREMTILWKSYRYLRNNPELRKPMAKWEEYVTNLKVYHIPKHKVRQIESKLQNGDVIGITTNADGGFCSHVGLIYKKDGRAHFLHASSDEDKVILDVPITDYLYRYKKNAGIIVGRPKDI